MSMLTALRNVATSTRLREGSLEALVSRIEKMQEGMTDIDKAKLEAKISDCFQPVTIILDDIEKTMLDTRINELQANSRGGVRHNPNTVGFRLPKGD